MAGSSHVGLVVEGPGDKGALPILLRNYLASKGVYTDVLGKPVPLKGKGSATRAGGVEGFVATAARPGCVGVVVLLDADHDLVCELGPSLYARASTVVGIPVVIAIANRDYEDWLYCSVETLGLGDYTWVAEKHGKSMIPQMLAPETYIKPVWQPKLTARMDIALARGRSHSLDRLLTKIDELVEAC